jgi:hypothetical protein
MNSMHAVSGCEMALNPTLNANPRRRGFASAALAG